MKAREEIMQKSWVYGSLACFCCLLWGSAFPCIKIGYGLFEIGAADTGSQILFAGCRFFLAGLMVIAAGSLMERRILVPGNGASWFRVIKLSSMQTFLQYLLFYIGLAHASGVKSSIIEASNVFLAILIAALVFRTEKLTAAKIGGSVIGFAGVVLINLDGSSLDASMSLTGEGFVFLSAICYAVSSALIKRYSAKDHTVMLSGWQFAVGGLVMILVGLAMKGSIHPESGKAYLLLLYMAFISAAAYTVWGILLKYNPISRVSVFGFSNPVFGVLLSALLLQESSQAFSVRGLIALLLVCCGIVVVNRSAKETKVQQEMA